MMMRRRTFVCLPAIVGHLAGPCLSPVCRILSKLLIRLIMSVLFPETFFGSLLLSGEKLFKKLFHLFFTVIQNLLLGLHVPAFPSCPGHTCLQPQRTPCCSKNTKTLTLSLCTCLSACNILYSISLNLCLSPVNSSAVLCSGQLSQGSPVLLQCFSFPPVVALLCQCFLKIL